MVESIRIKINTIGRLKLIDYKLIEPTMPEYDHIGIYNVNIKKGHLEIDVDLPTYCSYDGYDRNEIHCIIDSVIKQINRSKTINKLLNE